jgi:hypothetical protein
MRIERTISGNDITAVATAAPMVEKVSCTSNCRSSQPPTGPRVPSSNSSR